ncbi:DUF559 domain-containing protein [Streptomyces sp. NPDC101158]|uniref:DUF559 domain-containing protein n=1 Tax=Streptomyces sp. NPDC101158 TaxID=3366117 RepID=UPI003812192D
MADEGGGKYCSDACRHVGKRTRAAKTCPVCATVFEVPASLEASRRTCSRKCRTEFLRTDPTLLAVLAQARHNQLTSRTPTRPERILYGMLDQVIAESRLDVVWEPQYRVGRWTVDAAIPTLKIVLQADGDYWHGLHPKWREDPRVRRNMDNDAYQNRKLREMGWTVLRFWECNLIRALPSCAKRLAAALAANPNPPSR